MARQSCPLSSRHIFCLISVFFAAFLIRSNESLIPIWGTRCISSRAVSGSMSNHDGGGSCLRTSFFRAPKSSSAVGSSGDDEGPETPTYFFADKDTDISDEKIAAEEAAEQARLDEIARQEAVEQARLDEIARQEKLEEEVRLAEEQREKMFDEWKEKTVETVENVIKPLSEIQEGVPEERIKGAALAATVLTLFVSKGVVASGAVGLSAAYLSISKSVAGDVLRQVGEVTWDATETASKLVEQLGVFPAFGEVDKTVVNKYKRRKLVTKSDVDKGELAFIEAEDDDDLARVLKEAESVIGEADSAIAKAEADQKEKIEQSIEAELKQISDMAEIEEQVEVMGEAEEVVEDEALEESKEEVDEYEEGELEEDDDVLFDDDQFMAAVELAQEGIEGKIVGVDEIITDNSVKAEWDAAGELANELRQDIDSSSQDDVDKEEDDDFDDIDLEFEDIDVEALGRAAREAVDTLETEQQETNEAVLDEKQQWADSMIEEDDDEDDDFDFEEDEILFSADNLNAARAAVEASVNSVEDINIPPSDINAEVFVSKDWSSLKVVELREELKKRNLKTSGKKANLVSLLEESDLSFFNEDKDNTISDDDGDNSDEIDDFEDFDIEELGRQARAAVEMFQTNAVDFDEEPTEEMLAELESELAVNGEFLEEPKPSVDISNMTVAQLKDECRSKGLKVGGKKAELVERLKNSTE